MNVRDFKPKENHTVKQLVPVNGAYTAIYEDSDGSFYTKPLDFLAHCDMTYELTSGEYVTESKLVGLEVCTDGFRPCHLSHNFVSMFKTDSPDAFYEQCHLLDEKRYDPCRAQIEGGHLMTLTEVKKRMATGLLRMDAGGLGGESQDLTDDEILRQSLDLSGSERFLSEIDKLRGEKRRTMRRLPDEPFDLNTPAVEKMVAEAQSNAFIQSIVREVHGEKASDMKKEEFLTAFRDSVMPSVFLRCIKDSPRLEFGSAFPRQWERTDRRWIQDMIAKAEAANASLDFVAKKLEEENVVTNLHEEEHRVTDVRGDEPLIEFHKLVSPDVFLEHAEKIVAGVPSFKTKAVEELIASCRANIAGTSI